MFKWNEIALNHLGIKEVTGQKDNPKIVQFFADVGHSWVEDDETPWCAAFVGSCLEKAGVTSTKMLNARSYLKWGRKIAQPVPGCIVVFKRGNSSWQGHVAFFVGIEGDYIKVLGGNQGNTVKVSSYHKDDLLGYRMPKTKMNSKTNVAAVGGGIAVLVGQAETIGEIVNDLKSIGNKGGDMADKIGNIFSSGNASLIAVLAVVGLLGFIIYERNKKVNEHGL